RLARFGAQIEAAIATPGDEAIRGCERLQGEITDHREAKLGSRSHQIARTEMAVRLVRWLARPLPALRAFSEFAQVYRQELSFVDWARESIGRGDVIAGLSQAYQRLDQAVLERREGFNQRFAESLADWTSSGSDSSGVLGVEDVIPKVLFKVL